MLVLVLVCFCIVKNRGCFPKSLDSFALIGGNILFRANHYV